MADRPHRPWWRRLLRLGLRVAIVYVGVVVVLLLLENWFIYHPTPATERWRDPPDPRVQEVSLRSADGTALHGWWCPTPGWAPADGAVLYCHGNAGNLSDRAEVVARWQNGPMRQAVLVFDYPGFGRSEGKPSERGCYAAADACWDWLTGVQNVPPERILLYGESLGGAVAVEQATRRPHRALVLQATFTSIPDMAAHLFPWAPVRWLVRHRFDNLARLPHCRQPVFLVHGTADSVVPFTHGERLAAAANEPREFLPLPGRDHGIWPGDFDAELKQFLDRAEAGVLTR